jgi:ankyrin repeat protein
LLKQPDRHEATRDELLRSTPAGGVGEKQLWFAAVRSGDVETVKRLIAAGTDINMKNDEGRTALHIAALQGTYGDSAAPLVSALLAAGADKDARQKDGWTPLHVAVANSKLAAVSALLAFKAQTEVWDEVGNTPLHMAAQIGIGPIVQALLAAGADKNVRNTSVGATPLHFAAFYYSRTSVKILLAAGADKHAKNKYGCTALDLAKEEHGKFASQRSSGGYNSLYSDAAKEKQCAAVVELLSAKS